MRCTFSFVVLVTMANIFGSSFVSAQTTGGGSNNNNNNNQQGAGIHIDVDGLVRTASTRRIPRPELLKLQQAFSSELADSTLVSQTDSRVISLKQLDQAVNEILRSESELPVSLSYLAGLQRIDYVVIDPERRDVRLVGPAEGFAPGTDGRVVGQGTGRPPIQLDDLVIALRSAASGQREIGVSIDPTNENMAKLQNFIRSNSSVTSTASAERRIRTMATLLGNQEVSLWGVPENSHFATALVEADLRMKQIALGIEPSKVRGVSSHLALLRPEGNSLQRWWFMPLYEPIASNEDRTVFAIRGQRAQLMAQEEISDASGDRSNSGTTRRSTEQFAKLFTEHFEELAEKNPAFAELQSLYDLALAAALIRENAKLGNLEEIAPVLMRDDRLPQFSFNAPRYVQSKSNTKKVGGVLLGLVGGVTINVNRTARDVRSQEIDLLPESKIDAPEGNWWWNPRSSEM